MSLRDVVRARRMVRRFAPEPQVAIEVVNDLLDLAVRAPSAGFSQGWDYLVLRDPADRAGFWEAASAPVPDSRTGWLAGVSPAPTLILCLADEGAYRRRYAAPDKGSIPPAEQDWPVPYWLTDTAMGALLILLGATERGLGSLFFGVPGPASGSVKERFAIPADRVIVGVIALGTETHRARSPSLRRPRRGVDQVAHWGRFGVPGTAESHPSARMPEAAPPPETTPPPETRPASGSDPARPEEFTA